MVYSKLELDLTTSIKLFHVRYDGGGGMITVDLQDDDDFEVFKSHATNSTNVNVKVVVLSPEVSGNPTVSPSHEST